MEKVNHPAHYNTGKIEVIDAIEDWNLGFNLGNAVKYIARASHKENTVEDLKKAAWYIDREIKRLEKNPEPTKIRKTREVGYFGELSGFSLSDDDFRRQLSLEENTTLHTMVNLARKTKVCGVVCSTNLDNGFYIYLDRQIPYGKIWIEEIAEEKAK